MIATLCFWGWEEEKEEKIIYLGFLVAMVAVHRSQELLSVFLGDQDWGALQKPVNQNTAHQDQLSLDLC